MSRLFRKTDDFILNGRTIPRADPLNCTAVQWGAVQIPSDDLMGLFVCICDIATCIVFDFGRIGHAREGNRKRIAPLDLQCGEIDASAEYSRRCSSLESADGKSQFFEVLRQSCCSQSTVRSGDSGKVADEDLPAEISAAAKDDGAGREFVSDRTRNAGDPAVFGLNRDDLF